jgi:hypothetical protein
METRSPSRVATVVLRRPPGTEKEEEMDERGHQWRERRIAPRRSGAGRRVFADRRFSQLRPEEQAKLRGLLKSCGFPVPPIRLDLKATGERRRGADRRLSSSRRTGRDRRAA